MLHDVTLCELRTADLPELIQGLIIGRVVTAANQKQVSIVGILDTAEVVRPVRVVWVGGIPDHICGLVPKIDGENATRVLNQQTELTDRGPVLYVLAHLDWS